MKKKISKQAKVLVCFILLEIAIYATAVWYDQHNKTKLNDELKVELQLIREQNKVIINSLK